MKLVGTVIVLVLVLFGSSYYILQTRFSSQEATPTPSTNVSYSSEPVQIPLGASVIHESVEASWIGRQGVVARTSSLVRGTVLGVVNTTISGSSTHYFVITYYMFKTSSALVGSAPAGADILVKKSGGIAHLNGLQYVNESYQEFPPLQIGAEYILALTSSGDLLGPAAVFQVKGDLVHSNFDWNLPGVTITSFLQTWNGVFQVTSSTQITSTSTTTSKGP